MTAAGAAASLQLRSTLVKHKLLEAMRLVEADRQLTGRVEVDDAYLGGQRSGGKSARQRLRESKECLLRPSLSDRRRRS